MQKINIFQRNIIYSIKYLGIENILIQKHYLIFLYFAHKYYINIKIAFAGSSYIDIHLRIY